MSIGFGSCGVLKLKKLISILMLICFLITASALTIEAPEVVEVNSQEVYFLVNITNESENSANLKVNFYAPTETQVSSSKFLAKESKTTAKIFVKNNFTEYTEINSKLEVYFGTELVEKQVLLKFYPQANPAQITGAFTAFFSLGNFFEDFTNFSTLEYGLMFLLILVAAVLLVAFIARVIKRVE